MIEEGVSILLAGTDACHAVAKRFGNLAEILSA